MCSLLSDLLSPRSWPHFFQHAVPGSSITVSTLRGTLSQRYQVKTMARHRVPGTSTTVVHAVRIATTSTNNVFILWYQDDYKYTLFCLRFCYWLLCIKDKTEPHPTKYNTRSKVYNILKQPRCMKKKNQKAELVLRVFGLAEKILVKVWRYIKFW